MLMLGERTKMVRKEQKGEITPKEAEITEIENRC